MDWTAIIAGMTAGVGGIATGAGVVWRYFVRRLDSAHEEIARLNELRVQAESRRAADKALDGERNRSMIEKQGKLIGALKVTLDAREGGR